MAFDLGVVRLHPALLPVHAYMFLLMHHSVVQDVLHFGSVGAGAVSVKNDATPAKPFLSQRSPIALPHWSWPGSTPRCLRRVQAEEDERLRRSALRYHAPLFPPDRFRRVRLRIRIQALAQIDLVSLDVLPHLVLAKLNALLREAYILGASSSYGEFG